MAEIVLTAFRGKLRGKMEIPDNWDKRDIWLVMDMDTLAFSPLGQPIPDTPITKRSRFAYSGGGQWIKNKAYDEYHLVEVV